MHAGHRTDFAWIASNHKSQSTRAGIRKIAGTLPPGDAPCSQNDLHRLGEISRLGQTYSLPPQWPPRGHERSVRHLDPEPVHGDVVEVSADEYPHSPFRERCVLHTSH